MLNKLGRMTWVLIAVAFSGIGTKYLPEHFGNPESNIKSVDKNLSEDKIEIIPDETSQKLVVSTEKERAPYLDKKPIIDGNLFIEHYYNDFVFGGVNFPYIELAVRTANGNAATLQNKNPSELRLQISEKPYIEFKYKDFIYAIEVTVEVFPPDFVTYYYELREIEKASMYLKAPQDL